MNVEYSGYMVVNDGTYGNLEIRSIGKGALPNILKGSFTKHGFATQAIDSYISKNKVKDNGVKTNGKAERTSRG